MRGSGFALVCTSAFLFASVASAQDPYTDFRVPEARSFTWLVNGNSRWNGDYSAFPGSSSDSRAAHGNVLSLAHGHAESEALVSDHLLQAQGRWDQNRSTQRYSPGGFEQTYDYAADLQDYEVFAGANTTRYRRASPWGIDAALSAFYAYSRDARGAGNATVSGPFENQSRSDFENHNYRGSLDASAGPGYGRVRDVTGVFDMQVLEERLAATGRLSHPLSAAARQRLAELFSVSGDIQSAHDRPDRYLWRDVERILAEDGAIEAGTFDAWSLMRALEPATLSIAVTRSAGWRVSGAYELVLDRGHSDTDARYSVASLDGGILTSSSASVSSDRASLDENRGFGRLDVAWHRPFGMRWQTDVTGTARYGDGPRRMILLSGAVGLTNVLADRWVATLTAFEATTSDVVEGVRTSPSWNLQGSAQLSYFFEDSWSISAGVDHQQTRPMYSNGFDPTVPKGYFRSTQVVVGLTYRPVGRFVAPGLNVTERLAPGGI